ncbi:rhamnulokinase [Paenibacillus illinoisensis]|uniref:rhamnulokinase n=1 Tax=Paenibacillus illinoisensis TaxID=59845 RepID=UPI000FDAF668|nr:rhamnulokinase family protein [Paenibacillus illinoisensis]
MGNKANHVLASDYGAGSGRVVRGSFDGEMLALQEVHRFSNDPVQLADGLYWDFLRLFHELKQGIVKGTQGLNHPVRSIAVDTWGVDYGLVDGAGRLCGNPRHYRESRNANWMKETLRMVNEEDLYTMSGVLPQQINTVFQLVGSLRENAELPPDIRMLFMPDLFHFYLSGQQACEYTIASTSGLLHAGEDRWNESLFGRLGLPETLFPPIVRPGTVLGRLTDDLCAELRIEPMQVISVGSHDTASALAAIPASDPNFAFISCGTWSLMGMERDSPVLDERSRGLGFTNEGTVSGKTRILKNRSGLWLLQECKRQWERENHIFSHQELVHLASSAPALQSFILPGDAIYLTPGDMPERIRKQCNATMQVTPETIGAIVRCILESLALEFRQTLDELELVTGSRPNVIHMVGGGVQNRLLCQFTANSTGIPVVAGPVEATAAGNCMVQFLAHGEVGSLSEIRKIAAASFTLETYEPEDNLLWQEAYEIYQKLNGRLTKGLK